MRVPVSMYKKYANQYLRIYVYVAHTVFCMYVCHGSELHNVHMRVVKTLEYRQQSADDCLRIFVHGDMQLLWVSYTHA